MVVIRGSFVVAVVVGCGLATAVTVFLRNRTAEPQPSPVTTGKAVSESSHVASSEDAPVRRAKIVRDVRLALRKSAPPPSQTEDAVQLPDGTWGVKRPDGTVIVGSIFFEPDEPTIEGAISSRRMMLDHREEAGVLQTGIGESSEERDRCMVEFGQRGGKVSKQYNWVIALKCMGDGKEIYVTEVQAPSALWPEEFDEQVKDCYLDSFSNIRFSASERVEMTVEYPLCVYPSVSTISEGS